jgi:uncharacterized cupin superfamily protein
MTRSDRTIVNINETVFDPYDMEGPVQEDMQVLRVSYDGKTRRGIYVMRMEPGAVTVAHTHACMEEFMILEGELIESDGTILKKGDICSYQPGSHHNSRTEIGCVLIAFDWDRPSA